MKKPWRANIVIQFIYCIVNLINSGHIFLFGTPILGIGNLTTPFQTSRDSFPDRFIWGSFQTLYNGIYPRPRQTLKIGSLLVARPYPHLYSMWRRPLPHIPGTWPASLEANNGALSANSIQIGVILHGKSDWMFSLSLSVSLSVSLSLSNETNRNTMTQNLSTLNSRTDRSVTTLFSYFIRNGTHQCTFPPFLESGP